jgi:hypothetical protein
MNTPIVVSFSGGRTSAYMLRLLLDNHAERPMHVLFANTGKELPETLDFVAECGRQWGVPIVWLEAVVVPEKGKGTSYKVVDYETANRTGAPFEAVIAKYGIPSKQWPHCSRELKIQPIRAWIADHICGDFDMAIGIRADEMERAKQEWYPLVGWNVTKATVRAFWDAQSFDLRLKDYEGNCDLCFKKSLRKKLTIIEQRPGTELWWAEMEATYGGRDLHGKGGNWNFHHGNVSTERLRELQQRGRFQRAQDEHLIAQRDPVLDFETNCSCGLQ